MASQGPFFPGTVAQDNARQGNRLAWDGTDNVQADDSRVNTCAFSPASYRLTNRWIVFNFGFSIPDGQVIAGFELSFECQTNITLSGQCRDGTAELISQGVAVGQILSSGSDWTAGSHTRIIGASGNLWGWSGATPALVNDATFGVRFDVQVASGNSASFDWLALKVYYTAINYGSSVGSGGVGVGGAGGNIFASAGTDGVGVGGAGGTAVKSVATGGVGAGGAGLTQRIAASAGSGGVGVGGQSSGTLVAKGGIGGAGVGGDGIVGGRGNTIGSGGVGVGGAGGNQFNSQSSGGVGVGGSSTSTRRRFSAGSGGVGVGGTGDGIRLAASVGSGGVGVGGTGASSRTANTFGSGGVGVGGTGLKYTVADGDTDPEDSIPRKHRGQVTRRMVFEAIRRAIADGPLSGYKVFLSDDEPDMNNIPPGNTFAVVIPGDASNDQGDTAGGGPFGTIREDVVEVRVYSASSVDQQRKATNWTLKIDTGAMERARKIRKTLHLNDLIDDAGWLLLSEPMRATTTGKAAMRRATPMWGYYAERFQVTYTEYLG